MYLASNNLFFAFLKANTVPDNVSAQITKLDIRGAAICMHGYNALEGFGRTRTKNQSVANTDTNM